MTVKNRLEISVMTFITKIFLNMINKSSIFIHLEKSYLYWIHWLSLVIKDVFSSCQIFFQSFVFLRDKNPLRLSERMRYKRMEH